MLEKGKKPEYQDITGFSFEEVVNEEADEETLKIIVTDNKPDTDIEKAVKKRLTEENWWLNDYWRKKGLPKEQISINVGDHTIEVYNFEKELEPEQINELNEVIRIFSHIKNGEVLQGVKYILIDNEQHINIVSGGALNGKATEFDKSIKIYPNALKPIAHRIKSVSNFEGTLIHELSHEIIKTEKSGQFTEQWAKQFNWESVSGDQMMKLPGGLIVIWKCNSPERCITEYAKSHPDEDICDSMVTALKEPQSLDAEKLVLLKEKFLNNLDEKGEVSLQIKKGEEIKLPRLHDVIKFTRETLIIRVVNRSTGI